MKNVLAIATALTLSSSLLIAGPVKARLKVRGLLHAPNATSGPRLTGRHCGCQMVVLGVCAQCRLPQPRVA